MDYKLDAQPKKRNTWSDLKKDLIFFGWFVRPEIKRFSLALICIIITSGTAVLTPYLIARSIDIASTGKGVGELAQVVGILAVMYAVAVVLGYYQARLTGFSSQAVLYRLRKALFGHIQTLPISFFQQNQGGDLMSRLNNDTDKLNQALSETIMRFIGTFFQIFGIGIFVFFLNVKLALVLLTSAVVATIIAQIVQPHLRKTNKDGLAALGSFSANIQEQLTNFKVIVALGHRAYFTDHLGKENAHLRKSATIATMTTRFLEPVYDLAGYAGLISVFMYGIYLVERGEITLGILVGFIAYAQKFYDPLRFLGQLFGSFQSAFAALGRIHSIFSMRSDLEVLPDLGDRRDGALMEIDQVSFGYTLEKTILNDVSLRLEPGKTYAIIGPTGGGKSTLVSLMSRLFDPSKGTIWFHGRDIRTFTSSELAGEIGVILQEPFLFTGTVADNIRYGNPTLEAMDDVALTAYLENDGLLEFFSSFPDGITTPVSATQEGISLGQKQLIAFVRILLRKPSLFILDEATANIDTGTEQRIGMIVDALPATTTKVIIAHRLSTIREADEICFVNNGMIEPISSFDDALVRIKTSKRKS